MALKRIAEGVGRRDIRRLCGLRALIGVGNRHELIFARPICDGAAS
jgi:hypothetical protein